MGKATASGWQWLVDVSSHAGLAALMVALAFGVSIFGGWKLPRWWYGLLILGGFYAVLFVEGAYRVYRDGPVSSTASAVDHRGSWLRVVREIRAEIDSGRQSAEAFIGESRVTATFPRELWNAHHHALGEITVASAGSAYSHARRTHDLFAVLNDKIRRRDIISDEEWRAAARQAERSVEALDVLEQEVRPS